MTADFTLTTLSPTLALLTPQTDAAQTLIDDGAFGDAATWAGGLVVEARALDALLDALAADGYAVA